MDLSVYNTLRVVLKRMCEQHNIKDFYLEGWTHIDWSYNGIDKEKIYSKNATEILDVDLNPRTSELRKYQDSQFIKPNKYHPNEIGHKRIAEEMSRWI